MATNWYDNMIAGSKITYGNWNTMVTDIRTNPKLYGHYGGRNTYGVTGATCISAQRIRATVYLSGNKISGVQIYKSKDILSWDATSWTNSGLRWNGTAWTKAQYGAGGGGGTPGGSSGQVQFNKNSSFGGDANLTWEAGKKMLKVMGGVVSSNKFSGNTFKATYISSAKYSGVQLYKAKDISSWGSSYTNSGLRWDGSAWIAAQYATGGVGGGGATASGNFADWIVLQQMVGVTRNYRVIEGLKGNVVYSSTDADAAFAYANKGNCHIFVRSGIYILSNNLGLSGNTWLQGNGRNTMMVTQGGWLGAEDVSNIHLSDFNVSGKYGIWIHADNNDISGIKINDIELTQYAGGSGEGSYAGFMLYNQHHRVTRNVIYRNCLARNCTVHGWQFSSDGNFSGSVHHFLMDNCKAYHCGYGGTWSTGLDFENMLLQDGQFTNCIISGSYESGFHFESNIGISCQRVTFTNCESSYNGLAKVDASYASGWLGTGLGMTFVNCIAKGNQRHGFRTYGGSTFIGCIIDGSSNKNARASGSGIQCENVNSYQWNLNVIGCSIKNFDKCGIRTYRLSASIIEGNIIENALSGICLGAQNTQAGWVKVNNNIVKRIDTYGIGLSNGWSTVTNNSIYDCDIGLRLDKHSVANGNLITKCTTYGIMVANDYSNISNNFVSSNTGINIYGDSTADYNTISYNTVMGPRRISFINGTNRLIGNKGSITHPVSSNMQWANIPTASSFPGEIVRCSGQGTQQTYILMSCRDGAGNWDWVPLGNTS